MGQQTEQPTDLRRPGYSHTLTVIKRAYHNSPLSVIWPLLLGIGALPLCAVHAQPPDQSNLQLIQSLSVRSSGPDGTNEISAFSCGETDETRRQRAIARQLALQKSAAGPELATVLRSIKESGRTSPFFTNLGWLALAYARSQGPAAVQLLRTMSADPKLDSFRVGIDRAIALALGLTSYVSGLTDGQPTVICRRGEPRDSLNLLISSLQHGDQGGIESSLGPSGLEAFTRMLTGKSWTALYQEIWHRANNGQGAVGYAFAITGRWSEPEETLDENRSYDDTPLKSDSVTLGTRFTTAGGADCGRYTIDFQKLKQPTGGVVYRLNNSDLDGLLRIINTCYVR